MPELQGDESRVSLRLFLWLFGSLITILIIIFAGTYHKLDVLVSNTHSIELKVVALQKDVGYINQSRTQDHIDIEAFKRSVIEAIGTHVH